MLIAIPTGIKIFNWIGTMWGGSIRFTTSMLFALAFIAMFTIGGISGVMHSVAPSDLQQTDTYFVVAHIHYVFFGGTALGLFSGIYFWFPKIFGRLMDEKLGMVHLVGTLVGMNLAFFPMHFLGMYGMARRTFTYPADLGWNEMNLLSTVGAYILGLATLVFTWNVVRSAFRGALSGPNPWGAATLEWSIPSPPPVYNFRDIPIVHSRMPLWEADASKEPGIPHGKVAEDVNSITGGRHAGGRGGVPGLREQDERARPGDPPSAAVVLAGHPGLRHPDDLRVADLPQPGRGAAQPVAPVGGGRAAGRGFHLQVGLRARALSLTTPSLGTERYAT
jgi:cytochrome c oxidase subunit 1